MSCRTQTHGWQSAAFAVSCAVLLADVVGASERLPRENLLVYRAETGEVRPVRKVADWQKRRAEIIRGMEQIMGPFPDQSRRCPLEMRIEEETDHGTFLCRRVSYASEPGSRVPAYLLVPKAALTGKKRLPAVLALHPTDMEYGNRVVVEQLRPNYRSYGHDLAEREFVVLAPAYPLMAQYQPDLKALGYQSGTMKAIWDNIRGLDLLQSLPYARARKLGALGHSLGGHNAIFTALFDSRIQVVVSSCGFDSFVDYMEGNIKGWTSDRYMPRLLQYKDRLGEIPFDFSELIGGLAPRPVFISAPLGDANFKWRSVDGVVRAARPVYELYRAAQNLEVLHPDCGHDFPPEVREKAYLFLSGNLQ